MRIKEMLAAGLLILVITFNVIIVGSALGQTYDFGSFAASGINLTNQDNPYDANSPLVFESVFPPVNAGGRLPNLNPPFTLLFFRFITEQNVLTALNIWRGLSAGMYLVTLLILARRYQPGFVKLIWGLALAGIWHTIGLGQIYVPLLLIATLAWINLEEKR
jgi:alpha-1,2-mannosyltransferase